MEIDGLVERAHREADDPADGVRAEVERSDDTGRQPRRERAELLLSRWVRRGEDLHGEVADTIDTALAAFADQVAICETNPFSSNVDHALAGAGPDHARLLTMPMVASSQKQPRSERTTRR